MSAQDPTPFALPRLECFSTVQHPPDIVPGRPQRAWMDQFPERHPYRCLPLSMANTTGWEMLCPMAVTLEWDGGVAQTSLKVTSDTPHPQLHHFVTSHFSSGVATFHPGYLFRTPPGWSMWVMGPPNHIKDGVQPLVGLVETDWLPFPFTMNWKLTRPGRVRFAKGEPFCFITLAQDKPMEAVEPVIRSLESDMQLHDQYTAWRAKRTEFNTAVAKRDPTALREHWQRFYFNGEIPDDLGKAPDSHTNRRRLPKPRVGR
jgi:hypothetical protein